MMIGDLMIWKWLANFRKMGMNNHLFALTRLYLNNNG